jgi:electron transfer flavoprotein beta subunit
MMDILVFTKRVPVTQEEELRITGEGKGVDLTRLPYKMNDWDIYALEEAVRIIEKTGGTVTSISVGDKESDEVLRRAIAMGANDGLLIEVDDIFHDPYMKAQLIHNFLKKESIPFDVLLAGVQTEDDQFASVGGILAALLKLPYASMVIGIDAIEKDHLVLRRELEGGLQERIRIKAPCALSIQSGINAPRYVSIMGVRKASKVERKYFKARDYTESASTMIEVTRWVYPPKKEGAALIEGDMGEVCGKLLSIMKEKGVYK